MKRSPVRFSRLSAQRGKFRSVLHVLSTGIYVVVAVVFFSIPVFAQNTVTGAFQGKVSNNLTGQAVPGASVTINNERTGESYALVTDSRGEFFQGLLAPGSYLITIEIASFKPQRLRMPLNISKTGEVVPVPVSLEPLPPGAVASAPVTVDADNIRVEINTTDARRDGSFEEKKISAVPVGSSSVTRTLDELALLLPGVAPPPQTIGDVAGPGVGPGVGSAGQFAVNGLRSRANNFTVDGSDNNDEDIGVRRQGFVALSSQPVESVQEFQIITLLAPAQFGRNIGAQVNIVSKSGGNKLNGSLYGFFNSNHLNARNHFDTTNGNDSFALESASGQPVLLDGQPLMVRNNSGGEDSFTALQGGGTLGGSIVPNKLFYFLSAEYQKINANQEKSFAVPTIEERGPFGTGASGIFRDFFTNENVRAVPNTDQSAAVFSLFPFPNNSSGVYEGNTFTQILPADGTGTILSGRLDENFKVKNRQQTLTGRYNFTDDKRTISAINEALFSTVLSKIRTHNFSFFANSEVSSPTSNRQIFNQVRFSLGRSQLNFEELRDTAYLTPSDGYSHIPFLLNAPLRYNTTTPASPGVQNTGPVQLAGSLSRPGPTTYGTVESILRPVGQVIVQGFSPMGADVYNFPQTRVNTTYQVADELSVRQGNHNGIFGADIRRTDLNSDLPRLSRPLLIFNGAPRLIIEGEKFRLPTQNDSKPLVKAVDLVSLNAASSFVLTFNVDRPDSKVDLRYYQLNLYAQDLWKVRNNLSVSFGLRYEYNSPVHEANSLIERTFTDPRTSSLPGLEVFIDGRITLYEADKNNFAPRIGFAYSPRLFGNNRTSVFRAGYGIYYDQILGSVANQSRNVFPTFTTIDFNFAITDLIINGLSPLSYTNPSGISTPGYDPTAIPFCRLGLLACPPAVLPGTINIINLGRPRPRFPFDATSVTLPSRKIEMPSADHYSLTFEQQMNRNLTISVGYIGTRGSDLLRFTTPNLGPYTTTAPGAYDLGIYFRPFRPVRCCQGRSIGTVYQFETTAFSGYDSLQGQLRGRFINHLNFTLAYSYSKVTDDVSDVFDLAGAYALPQNSFDLEAERGPANFDVRHRWTYQATYSVPTLRDNSFLRLLTSDLQVASTGKFHSGQPFTVNSTIDVNLDGNLTDRLNHTDGLVVTGDRSQPLRLDTNNPFSLLAPFGQDGIIKRNSFRAGHVLELDLSIIKRFAIAGRMLNFRTDIFSFINRANFGIPVRLLEAPGFGKATSTVTPARRVQFSLKYEF